MNLFFFRLIVPALAFAGCLGAQERVQGAFQIQATDGSPVLFLPGESGSVMEAGEDPLIEGALVRMRLEKPDSAFLLGSNGVGLLTSGEADFAVERFAQEQWDAVPPAFAELESEPTRSRIVLSQTGGEIAVDCSLQAPESRLALETPVGTVDAGRAVWSFSLVYDPRSRIFNFLVKVRGGEVRFSDRSGRSFRLYAGQRLSGVGSSSAPAIEIGELTDDEAELIFQLEEIRGRVAGQVASWDEFTARMVPLAGAAASGDGGEPPSDFLAEDRARPMTIDFVPAVPDSIPFRGLVRLRADEDSETP